MTTRAAWKPTGQISDAMRLAGARRTVEQQPLLRREPHRSQRGSLFREPQHVPLERSKCPIRQDDFVTLDGFEIVNPNPGRVPGPLRARFQRQDSPSIARPAREMSLEPVEHTGCHLRTEVARRGCHFNIQEATLSIVVVLRQHDGVRSAIVSQQPQSVLQAPLRFAAADVDVLELRRSDLDDGMALFQQLGEVRHVVAIRRPDADEVLRNDSPAKELVEGCLQVGLLTKGVGTRCCQHLLRAERGKMSGEALERVTVRTLLGWRLGCGGLQQRGACNDTGVADEAGIAGDHVFDVARRPVTKLATPFGYEMLSQWCPPPRRRPHSQHEHFGYRQT